MGKQRIIIKHCQSLKNTIELTPLNLCKVLKYQELFKLSNRKMDIRQFTPIIGHIDSLY